MASQNKILLEIQFFRLSSQKINIFPPPIGPGRDFEVAGRGKRAGAEAETTIRTDVGHSHHRDLPSAQFCQQSAVLTHRIDHFMTIEQQTTPAF